VTTESTPNLHDTYASCRTVTVLLQPSARREPQYVYLRVLRLSCTRPHCNCSCKSAGSERGFKRGASTPRARHEWPRTDDERIWTDRPAGEYVPFTLLSVRSGRALPRTPYAKSKGRCMHAPVSYQEQAIEDDDYLLLLCDRARRYVRTYVHLKCMHACCCTTRRDQRTTFGHEGLFNSLRGAWYESNYKTSEWSR